MQSFKKDLSLTSLCQHLPDGYFITSTEDLNKLVADYNSTLSNLLNHHAPLKSKTVRKRPSVPWYTAEIGAAKRLRRKAERKWRRTGLHDDFGHFSSNWKEAIVTPILKNPSLTSEFANLRPISNLQFISKLTEPAVFDQLQTRLLDHALYPLLLYQSA